MTLSQKDVDTIEQIVEERLEDKFPNLSVKVDKILGILSDFAGNLKNTQDEQVIQGDHLSKLVDKISALEKIHPGNQHSS